MIVFQHVAWPTWPACTAAVRFLYVGPFDLGPFLGPSYVFFLLKMR